MIHREKAPFYVQLDGKEVPHSFIEENTRKVTLDGITARLRNQCR